MKNRIILMAAAIAAMAVSCQKVEVPAGVKTEPMIISAGVETKTELSGTDILWTNGDMIAVFGNGNYKTIFTTEDSGKTATFAGEVAVGTTQFYAVYPYDEESKANGSTLTVSLPSDQTPVAGTFAEEHNISVAKGTRKGGANTEVTGVAFKNVCALLKFTVPSYVENVTSVVVSSESDLAGEMTINYSEDIPSVSVSGHKTVSMERSSDNPFEKGSTFWFVVAPTKLQGLTVTVKTANNNTYVMSTDEEIPLTAGKSKNIGVLKLGTTVSAAHTYADNVLTGTEVKVNLINPVAGTVHLTVKNSAETTVRQYSTTIDYESSNVITLPPKEDWPYLPKGDYILSGSYENAGGTERLYDLQFSITEGPDFTDKGRESFSAAAPMTSYSYYSDYLYYSSNPEEIEDLETLDETLDEYLKKYLDKANGMSALTIENVNSGKINLPKNIKDNPNYSIDMTVAVDNGASIKDGDATATKLGQHTVTTTYTFDDVSVRKDAICYITGLPLKDHIPSQNDPYKWGNGSGIGSLDGVTYGSDGVTFSLGNTIKMNLYAPGDINTSYSVTVWFKRMASWKEWGEGKIISRIGGGEEFELEGETGELNRLGSGTKESTLTSEQCDCNITNSNSSIQIKANLTTSLSKACSAKVKAVNLKYR